MTEAEKFAKWTQVQNDPNATEAQRFAANVELGDVGACCEMVGRHTKMLKKYSRIALGVYLVISIATAFSPVAVLLVQKGLQVLWPDPVYMSIMQKGRLVVVNATNKTACYFPKETDPEVAPFRERNETAFTYFRHKGVDYRFAGKVSPEEGFNKIDSFLRVTMPKCGDSND